MTDQAQPGPLLHREPYERHLNVTRAGVAVTAHGGTELRHQGVKVTLVEPGAMDPPIFADGLRDRLVLRASGVTAQTFDDRALTEVS
ncbi:hypothetical protein OG223_42145 [Streptomyces sp. NBC_01478]|nr:hypothetical protein [Streptomyces sp. NBC_01478]